MKADTPRREVARGGGTCASTPPHLLVAGVVVLVSFGQAWFRWIDWRKGFGDIPVIDQVAWMLSRGEVPVIRASTGTRSAITLRLCTSCSARRDRVHATVAWVFLVEALAFGLSILALPPMLSALRIEGRLNTAFQIAFVVNPLMWNAWSGSPATRRRWRFPSSSSGSQRRCAGGSAQRRSAWLRPPSVPRRPRLGDRRDRRVHPWLLQRPATGGGHDGERSRPGRCSGR